MPAHVHDAALRHADGCAACRRLIAAVGRNGDEATDATAPASAAEPDEASDLRRGTNVGRYVVMDVLGSGAMGVVYSAYDPELDRKVALKLLLPAGATGPDSRTRLVREAQAMARVSDPCVVPVHDAGVYQGRVFVAMELIEGQTLSAWLRAEKRGWREVIGVFLQAARGLAAAHAAGIIHRDFKPDNVLVGKDGRVRVGDFGLARTDGPHEPDPAGERPMSPVHLTSTGTLVGTPAYMAPEQIRKGAATAASDQFSFSVALYEGLYGRRPFSARGFDELALAILAGEVAPPPAGTRVPAWVRRVVLRGLSVAPERRFASMRDLVSALEMDPSIRRRRLLAASAVAMIALAGVVAVRASSNHEPQCRGAARELAAVWNPERKAAIRSAFLASGRPDLAAAAWASFDRLVDGYAAEWTAQHTQTCEATRIDGTQSEELMELRMVCLREHASQLRAIGDVFARPRPGLIDGAVKAATALPPLVRCQAESALRAPIPPPRLEQAAVVARLREQLQRASAHHLAGDYAAGLRSAQAVAFASRAVGYLPLEAEALELQARVEVSLRDLKQGVADYQDAANAAIAAGHSRVAASALTAMVWTVGVQLGDAEQGRRLLPRASAIAERLGERRLQADLAYFEGILRFQGGDVDGAAESFARAKAAREALFGPIHPDVAHVEVALGRVALSRGEYLAARAHYTRAIEIMDQALGHEHPLQIAAVGNLADLDWEELADYPAALASARRAVAIARKVSPDNVDLAFARSIAGGILVDLGRLDEGLAEIRAGVATIEAQLDPGHGFVSRTNLILARALSLKGLHEEAIARVSPIYAREVASGGGIFTSHSLPAATVLVQALDAAGRHDEAVVLARRTLAGAKVSPTEENAARLRGALCPALVDAGKEPNEAVLACARAFHDLGAALGPVHPATAAALATLGEARLATGDRAAGIGALIQAYAILVTREGDEPVRARARAALARASGRDRRSRGEKL